jgi:hypothetical protein
MKKVIRLTESDLVKVIKKIIKEQTSSGGYKFEMVYDLPNSSIEQINGMIKRNPAIRAGVRLVTDNPNQLVYTKSVRIDGAYKKVAKMNSLPNTCIDGELEFDITFLIKENKVKMIIDNMVFNARRIYLGNQPCSDCFNYGFIGDAPNPQSVGGRLLCDKATIWNRLISIITPNMQTLQNEIKTGFTNSEGVKNDYDF